MSALVARMKKLRDETVWPHDDSAWPEWCAQIVEVEALQSKLEHAETQFRQTSEILLSVQSRLASILDLAGKVTGVLNGDSERLWQIQRLAGAVERPAQKDDPAWGGGDTLRGHIPDERRNRCRYCGGTIPCLC
jgi:hypothetical protein